MQLAATESERRLQEEIRGFLAAERPDAARLPRSLEDRMEALRAWQARCHAAGYVGRAWPLEFGGGGRPAAEQIIVDQELAAAGAPEFANVVGLDVLGPSLLRFGSDEQRRRYIPAILAADEIWCQGFSEPDAGSDLASLRSPGRGPRRPLRAQRAEDLGLVGAVRALVRRAGPHARRRAEAPRDLDADRRHAIARRGAAADDADHRPRRVLRAVPRRRRRAAGQPARRARRRLEDRDAHARSRARHRRAAAPGQAAHVARPGGPRRLRAHASTAGG